jgi:hypothetical protein
LIPVKYKQYSLIRLSITVIISAIAYLCSTWVYT